MINTDNSGILVQTKTGKFGRTFHKKGIIKGKIPVYLEKTPGKFDFKNEAILCDPETLKQRGFID